MHSGVGIQSQLVDRVAALEAFVNGVQGCLSLKEVGSMGDCTFMSNLECIYLDQAMRRGRGKDDYGPKAGGLVSCYGLLLRTG
jgi:hypothetical protein